MKVHSDPVVEGVGQVEGVQIELRSSVRAIPVDIKFEDKSLPLHHMQT